MEAERIIWHEIILKRQRMNEDLKRIIRKPNLWSLRDSTNSDFAEA
jgi:hypothetical protein